MRVTKLPFEWHQPADVQEGSDVALEPKTIETVVGLMASTMIAVVRGAGHTEETPDER